LKKVLIKTQNEHHPIKIKATSLT